MTIVLLLHPSFPLWPGTVFTEFSLMCDDHARLFTENFTLSHSTINTRFIQQVRNRHED